MLTLWLIFSSAALAEETIAGLNPSSANETVIESSALTYRRTYPPRLPRWEFGLDYHKFDYAEIVPAPLKSTENAFVPRYFLGFTMGGGDQSKFRVRGQAEVAWVDTKYDGSTQLNENGTADPVIDVTANRFFALEVFPTYSIPVARGLFYIEPYSGLRYENWRRGLGKNRGTAIFNEDYTWFTLPVGAIFRLTPNDRFSIALDASLRLQFLGEMTARHSVNPLLQDGTVNMGQSVGAKFQLPMTVYTGTGSSRVAFIVSPWFEFRSFGASDVKPLKTARGEYIRKGNGYQGFMEPESRTYLYGVAASIGVAF